MDVVLIDKEINDNAYGNKGNAYDAQYQVTTFLTFLFFGFHKNKMCTLASAQQLENENL